MGKRFLVCVTEQNQPRRNRRPGRSSWQEENYEYRHHRPVTQRKTDLRAFPHRGGRASACPSSTFPKPALADELTRDEIRDFPEVSEVEVVRHFTRLSSWNYGVDSGFYPLGSCTMKYNPKVNETAARKPGLAFIHPLHPRSSRSQGAMEIIFRLEKMLG